MDPEDIGTVIEDVAKGAAAEADKITAEEAARGAVEDTTKGPTGEPSKATAEEAGKGPTREAGEPVAEKEVADDQPSSSAGSGSGRYLRVSDDLFVHLLGAPSSRAPIEGEVFDASERWTKRSSLSFRYLPEPEAAEEEGWSSTTSSSAVALSVSPARP